MAKRSSWKRSPKNFGKRLRRAQKQVLAEVGGQAGNALRAVDSAIRSRIYPARELSKQDAPGGMARKLRLSQEKVYDVSQSRDSDGVVLRVRIKPHYTAARTAAVRSVMTKIGRQNLLRRRGLLIQNSPRRGFSRLQFSSIPRLLQWAERKERGEQALRHKVRLPREALDKLIFTASRKEFEPRVLDAWRAGVKRGFS